MHTFLERSIRGDISIITKRQTRANNPGCKVFDRTKPNSYLMYLDANNLYGWTMSQSMPTHGLYWLTQKEILNKFGMVQNVLNLSDDVEDGFIFEVDNLHNDYPERLTIDESMLPPFQQTHFPSS